MSDVVLEQIKELAIELTLSEQAELVKWLQTKMHSEQSAKPKKSLYGLWADQGIDISTEDIENARREMWGNFPRDDI